MLVLTLLAMDFSRAGAVEAVAGAFHTNFMASAVEPLEKVLETVEVKAPRIPVISNVDAKAHSDPGNIPVLSASEICI